jgi:hypothetical protein
VSYTIPIRVLTVDKEGYHLMVTAVVNGYDMHLLIDTGATLTVLDINRARTVFPEKKFEIYNKFFMGIGTSNIKTFCTSIDQICFDTFSIQNKSVILIDMTTINTAYAAFDLPRIDGIVGGDILNQYKAVIDYDTATLTLSDC